MLELHVPPNTSLNEISAVAVKSLKLGTPKAITIIVLKMEQLKIQLKWQIV